MKKFLILICIIAAFSLTACNKNEQVNNDVENSSVDQNINEQHEEENKTENEDNKKNDSVSLTDLFGTYSWNKNYINESGSELDLNVELILKSDGNAEYSASDGYDAEKTRGYFEYNDGEIVYIREYYNYNGANGQLEDSKFSDENNMTQTFMVVDSNTLEGTYRDQTVTLKK